MAIQGKFIADFADFNAAVSASDAKLVEFQSGASKVEQQLNRVADSLSGRKLVSDAAIMAEAVDRIGGTSMLTEKELQRVGAQATEAAAKMKAMGVDVPPHIQAIADAANHASAATGGWLPLLREMGSSWVARIAEGQLLRDAVRAVGSELKAMAAFLPDIAMQGAVVGEVAQAYKHLTAEAGLLGSQLLGTLRAATHGTVSDFELMKVVNQDMAAGLTLTDKQFGVLAQGAFALAKATGGDVKTALDTMSDAMVTGRTRAIALLTGKIDATAAEEKYAVSMGKTIANLTDAGKIEALRIAILDSVGAATTRLGAQTDGLGQRVTQAQVAWANFTADLGKAIAESKVLEAGMGGVKQILSDTFGSAPQALIAGVAHKIDDALIALVGFGEAGVTSGGALVKEYYALEKVLGNIAQIGEGDAVAFEYAALGVAKLGAATSSSSAAQQRYAADVERIQGNLDSLMGTMTARGQALQADDVAQAGVDATTAKYVATLEGLRKQMEDARATEVAFIGPIRDEAAATDLATAAVKAHADALFKQSEAEKKIGAKIHEENLKLDAAYEAARVGFSGTATEAIIAHNHKASADYLATLEKDGALTDELQKKSARNLKQLDEQAGLDSAALHKGNIEDLQAEADKQKATYYYMAANVGNYVHGALQEQHDKMVETAFAATAMGQSMTDAETKAVAAAEKHLVDLEKEKKKLDEITAAAQAANRALGGSFAVTSANVGQSASDLMAMSMGMATGGSAYSSAAEQLASDGYSFEEIMAILHGGKKGKPVGPRIPGFVSGVENFVGGDAIVGEGGPELVNLPRGSNVIPFGRVGGSTTVTVNMHVSGVFDPTTKRQLAEAVGSEVMKHISQGRQF